MGQPLRGQAEDQRPMDEAIPAWRQVSGAAEDVTLLKDLTSVIMLLGLPCGQVVSANRQADNDHIA